MSNPSLCINCGSEVSSAYCPSCGQRHPPKKISLLNLYHDFQSRVYGFDGMFPRTLRDLTIRPGKVATAYIAGNRVKYVGPVGYFFVMLTIFILLLGILDIDFYELSQASSPFGKTTTTQQQEEGAQMVVKMFSDNLRIFQFILIPLVAFWYKIFFRKSGYSYLEMMVPSFFFYGHLEILGIVNEVVFYFTGNTFNSLFFPLQFIYFGFASMDIFGKGIGNFSKGMLVFLFSFIVFIILIGLFVFGLLLTNPEFMEKMKPS